MKRAAIVLVLAVAACDREPSVETELLRMSPKGGPWQEDDTLLVRCAGLPVLECQARVRGKAAPYKQVMYVDTKEARELRPERVPTNDPALTYITPGPNGLCSLPSFAARRVPCLTPTP